MATVACRELRDSNIRFNDVFLGFRVDYDAVAKGKKHSMASSDFAAHYKKLLERTDITGSRIHLRASEDVRNLPFTKKL